MEVPSNYSSQAMVLSDDSGDSDENEPDDRLQNEESIVHTNGSGNTP